MYDAFIRYSSYSKECIQKFHDCEELVQLLKNFELDDDMRRRLETHKYYGRQYVPFDTLQQL